jgi:hemolysin III
MRRFRLAEREQAIQEELANSISHGVGAIVAIVAAVILIATAARRDDALGVLGASVFAATMVFVYFTSTIYHSLSRSRAKRIFKILDHSAIFLLIAGTYTPFMLGVLRGRLGWWLLAIVWTLAILGVVFTAVSRIRYPTICSLIYLGMGWLIVVAIRPLWTLMAPWGLVWLIAGGLAYTGGIVFFAADRIRFGHLVWHLCVIAGTACHYVAVLHYSL